MLQDNDMLNHIYQSTEMGKDGVDTVLKYAKQAPFRAALTQQKTEYDKLYSSSGKMLEERGEKPKGTNPMAKMSAEMMAAMKVMGDHSTSKIAEMMIQGNTMGMTKSLQTLHEYGGADERVRDLANKLLETEQANIEQMKQFL